MIVIHSSVSVTGGIGSLINELVISQINRGDTVYFVFRKKDIDVVNGYSMCNHADVHLIPVETKDFKGMFYYKGLTNETKKLYYDLRKECQDEKIVIHFHNPMAIGVFGRVSKLPCICTIHSVYTKNRIVLALYRIILKKNIPFILVSKDMRRYYEMLSHKTEFHIVENGINDLPEGELESALQTRRNRKKYIVGFVADVNSLKGWKYVVEAFENQRNLEQDIQLMIYGRDFDKSVNQYFNNPAYPNIIYCGFKKNAGTTVIPLLDAMILPSLSEGMPMSIIEALRAGVPVLATKVGGIPEMIIEDETGLFIERDAKDIADKINKIVTWEKSETFFKCRNTYQRNYCATVMADKYFDVYKDLLG